MKTGEEKNSNIIQQHLQDLLATVSLRLRTKRSGLAASCRSQEQLIVNVWGRNIHIFNLFPIFQGNQAKNIWGAIRRQRDRGGSNPRARTRRLIRKSHPKHDPRKGGQIASRFTAAISIFAAVIDTLALPLHVLPDALVSVTWSFGSGALGTASQEREGK